VTASLAAARLPALRLDARLERDTELERRVREGEDPAIATVEVPEVDELVVLALRDELLEDRGLLAEFGLARLASRSGASDADEHRLNADRVEFGLLREIARAVPELTVSVWRLASGLRIDSGPAR